MLTPGTRIGGFLLGDLLGKGAMGEVYRGEQLSLKRPVAIKRIATHLLDNEDMVRRFKREAQVLAKVNHPNVVGVIECEEFPGPDGSKHLLLVMELIEGGRSLKSCLGRHVDWRLATAVIRMAADGLAAAFEQHVVHRDIKPDNIMMTHKGIAKLVDFGLAKATESTALTMQAAPMGTPLYMSPEACRGEEIGHAGDLYSLGVSWFQMLTGKFPFNAANLHGLLYKHISEPLPNPIGLMNDVPEPIVKLCYQCMEKDPANRPASALRLVEAIDALAAQGLILPRDARDLLAGGTGGGAPAHGSTTAATLLSDNKGAATAATQLQGAAPVNQGATVAADLSGTKAQAATVAAANMAATQPTAVPAQAATQPTAIPAPAAVQATAIPPSPVPAPAPAKGKGPMIAIAAVVLLALAGGGALLATRGEKPAEPSQANANTTPPKPFVAPTPVPTPDPATAVKPDAVPTTGLNQPLIAQPPKPVTEEPKPVVAVAAPVPVEPPKPVAEPKPEPPKPVAEPKPEPPKPVAEPKPEPPKPVAEPKPEPPKPSAFDQALADKRWADAKSAVDQLPADQQEAARTRLTDGAKGAIKAAKKQMIEKAKTGCSEADLKKILGEIIPAAKVCDQATAQDLVDFYKQVNDVRKSQEAKQ